MKLSRRLFLLSPLALAYKPSWGALSFPLPQGHFVPAKMPMHPVYPRPDNETQSHARHRWAHPDFRYEIPIGVQGGAWPFKYEIINGPSGATIGQYYGDPDYGVLKWAPASGDSGTKIFTIRVTDQELNTVDLTWSTTIDPGKFVFIDASVTTTGSGTITSPLKTFSDWYKNDFTDNTFHNKIIVFRDGSYTAVGDTANASGNVRMEVTYKTPSVIAFPDETPTIDWSGAKWFFANNFSDLFIAGLRLENARGDVSNSHFLWIAGDTNRVTVWNNYLYSLGNGTSGTDNPSGIFISSTGALKSNILIKSNTFDQFTNNGPNGSFCDIYVAEYVLIEENTGKNSDTYYGIWAKGTHNNVTIRANKLNENNTMSPIVLSLWSPWSGVVQHDYEVCWNIVKCTNRSTLVIPQEVASTAYNVFVYRNTFIEGNVKWRSPISEPYETDGNVSQTLNPDTWNKTGITINATIPNLIGNMNAGLVDSQGRLSGNYRISHIGRVGFEVSSEDPASIPKKPLSINIR